MSAEEKYEDTEEEIAPITVGDVAKYTIGGSIFSMVAFGSVLSNNKGDSDATSKTESAVGESANFFTSDMFALFVILGAVIAITVGTCFLVRNLRTKKHFKTTNVVGWEKLMSRYDSIISRWSEYEMDILKIVDYPMMTDMTAPTTIAFHQALRHARMTEPKNKNAENYLNSPFATAVTELEKAFEIAESTAKRSQWKQYDRDEQKRLTRAKDMLALALDTAGSSHERQIAYRGAMKLLSGLIDVPQVTAQAIEDKTTLALVA